MKAYLCLMTFLMVTNVFGQQNLGYFTKPQNIIQAEGGSTSSDTSFDPVLSSEIVNDPLGRLKLSSTMKNLKPDSTMNTRSVQDAALFKALSPSVVLIITKDSLGTGTIIDNQGVILTNSHVVGGNPEVGVILKPSKDAQKISKADVVRARVIKIDQVKDLALIQLVEVPADRAPVKLGDENEINIGMDVHAIGHPHGDSWTYTKGVISQYRNDYQWLEHKANVIQTQTPINPGNSGGPLLSDKGTLLGVNSFMDKGAQGLNFAVSVEDVKTFLRTNESTYLKKQAPPAEKTKCEVKQLFKGKTSNSNGEITIWDPNCSGKADLNIFVPNDKTKPIVMEMDRNGDGKIDVAIFSTKRNYKWEFSFWDNNFDGQWDLVGFHQKGEIKPMRLEDYSSVISKPIQK